jgi:hypothetical protein
MWKMEEGCERGGRKLLRHPTPHLSRIRIPTRQAVLQSRVVERGGRIEGVIVCDKVEECV